MTALTVLRAGPWVTVQDAGRPGQLALGVSRGGAADRLALAEGAALVGNAPESAAIELAAMGARFRAEGAVKIALTGADMGLRIDGAPAAANTCHAVPDGAEIEISPARAGVYGYLSVEGGIATPVVMRSRSVHTNAGIGAPCCDGDRLPLGAAGRARTDMTLKVDDRLSGGPVRILAGFQTPLFSDEALARFAATPFRRDPQSNRMGVRLAAEGAGFAASGGLSVLSEVVTPGDIQVAGDGTPIVLFGDCQTTGGYPRLGTVIGCDLPRVVQAGHGAVLRFRFVTRDEALAAEVAFARHLAALPRAPVPRLRDPADIPDLLGYQLISGAICGTEEDET